MRKAVSVALTFTLIALAVVSFSRVAQAEETKFIGIITRIDCAGRDAKTATVLLKDNKTEEPVTIFVNDELTLDKLKDHRIVEGDEIRCKYQTKDGKNVSTYFRKTAGC
jgi:hypothetical protein